MANLSVWRVLGVGSRLLGIFVFENNFENIFAEIGRRSIPASVQSTNDLALQPHSSP
jgi:hypothetical protein